MTLGLEEEEEEDSFADIDDALVTRSDQGGGVSGSGMVQGQGGAQSKTLADTLLHILDALAGRSRLTVPDRTSFSELPCK